ncbi:hypothetical protein KO566_11100 [Flavobacteriaceae bacterium XHP0103]|nr:hypothetical protein [Marixanthotalea marina]MBU3822612.1 hypothetical protein [Marixanthotalea marina]
MLYDKEKKGKVKRSYDYLHHGLSDDSDRKPKHRVPTMLNGKPRVNINN